MNKFRVRTTSSILPPRTEIQTVSSTIGYIVIFIREIYRIVWKETHMIKPIFPLIGMQILYPMEMGNVSNPKEKLNVVPSSDEWLSLLQSHGPVISKESLVE